MGERIRENELIETAPIDWCGLHRDYLRDGEMEIIVALVNSVKARVMLEIGCRDGRTASVLLRNVPTLEDYIGVDVPMTYEPALEHQRGEMVAWPGELATKDPRFTLVIRERGSLDLDVQEFPHGVDAVFIDGDHSEDVVRHDSVLAETLINPGGVVIWHDYFNGAVEVTKTIKYFAEQGWPINSVWNTWLAYARM